MNDKNGFDAVEAIIILVGVLIVGGCIGLCVLFSIFPNVAKL